MSFECECPVSILKFFTLASRIISRSPLPIYGHVLVSVPDGNGLEFVSVAPEMAETRCRVRVNVKGEGGVAVPSALMNEIIAALPPDENVMMSSDGKALNIRWKGGEGRIGGVEKDRFPSRLISKTEGKEGDLVIDAGKLATAAKRVSMVAGRAGKVKEIYTGVSLRLYNMLELAATDTYRLAVDRVEVRSANISSIDMVLPSRIVAEWGRICEETFGEVKVTVYNQFATLAVNTEHAEIFSTSTILVDEFPDYSVLVPRSEDCKTRIFVPTELLANVCRSILATVVDKTVVIELQCNESVSIKARGETSSFSVELPAEVAGEHMEVAFDVNLFTEGVESLFTETTVIELISPRHPCVIRGNQGEFRYVLMPMVQQ